MQAEQPGDGLIRYWLSLQGWRVGHVQNGVIHLPSQVHADYITELLARRWFPEAPMPLVGVYSPEEK
jgi:hypothetical protein